MTGASRKAAVAAIRKQFAAMTGMSGRVDLHVLYPKQPTTTPKMAPNPMTTSKSTTTSRSMGQEGRCDNGEMMPESADARVLGLRLDNAKRRNAMSPKMMVELAEAVDRIEKIGAMMEDGHAYGVVLYGANGTFCSGFDLGAAREGFMSCESGDRMSQLMQDNLQRLRGSGMHVACAVEGHSVGGGAELMMAGDMRLVGAGSFVQFVHGKMGVSPGWGGSRWLVEAVGRERALRVLLGGEKMGAERVAEMGLGESVAVGSPLHEAVHLLSNAMQDGQVTASALRAAKRSVVAASDCDIRDALMRERSVFAGMWGGDAHLRAMGL